MIEIARIDHVVLTVASIERTSDFYQRALGMSVEVFGGGRVALKFGDQKFNLHEAPCAFRPSTARVTSPCWTRRTPLTDVSPPFSPTRPSGDFSNRTDGRGIAQPGRGPLGVIKILPPRFARAACSKAGPIFSIG